ARDSFGIADRDSRRRRARRRSLPPQSSEQPLTRARPGRNCFRVMHELSGQRDEPVRHAAARGDPLSIIFMTVQEVDGRYLLVDEAADRLTVADDTAITFELLLLLLDRAEGKAEAAQPAFGGVHLSSGTGHRNPQRRMRLLIWLGQNGPLRHRPG